MNKKPNLFNQVIISSIEDYKNKIKTLTKQKERLIRRDKKHREEIERLNNIMNEFDKYLKEQFDIYKELDKIQDSRISCQLLIAREKLKELRGDNNDK